MAKKGKYEKKYDKELAGILRELDSIYEDLANQIGNIGATYAGSVDKSSPFVLSKYPLIQKRVDAVIKKLARRMGTTIVNGVRAAWTLANQKNNELCNLVFGEMVGRLTQDQERRYYASNGSALDAFLARKVKGLKLSDRVWNYAEECIPMVESTLELGIKTGEGAALMARDLKTYLKFPDKLFRRVRDNEGKLHLSKAAADFHPGQGVYRSSYKNAYRLARTETNIAYRNADHLRQTQLDFVVGIEIHLSNNHTCLGPDGKPHPFFDICDELQGKYPKWFDFKGWHPACRCFVTTILKTDDEIARDLDGVDRGSVNTVKTMPPQWNDWLAKNRDRVDRASATGRLPYFLNDNPWAWQEGVEMPGQIKPALVRAQERHMARTPEEVADIRARWLERQIAYNDAKMVLALADSIPDLRDEWKGNYRLGSLDQLREMYETGKFKSYGNLMLAARSVLDNIKEIRKQFTHLADPFKAMQNHGVAKTRLAHQAVEQKLTYFNSNGDLDWKIKKLKFEIDWLDKPENQKHSTWKVAQDAYRKALEEAETQKFWNDPYGGWTLQPVKWMNLAKTIAPGLESRMRVAWKKKDIVMMKSLIDQVQEEEKWQNNAKILANVKSNPIFVLLEQNNAKYTFISDMEQALASRNEMAFNVAKAAGIAASGTYSGLKSAAEPIINNLRSYNENDAATALDEAVNRAEIDAMERLINEGKEIIRWAAAKAVLRSYEQNQAAWTLNEKNNLGALEKMEQAIDAKDLGAFQGAETILSDAIQQYNANVKEAKNLVARFNAAGAPAEGVKLEQVIDSYVLADIQDALKVARKEVEWAELVKRAKMFTEGLDKDTLIGLKKKSLIGYIEDDIQDHDPDSLRAHVEAAEKIVKEWYDLATKAVNLSTDVPQAIEDELADAVATYDKTRINVAIKRAENFKAVFAPMIQELKDLEARKQGIQDAIKAKQEELKKKRDELAARRKTVKDEEEKIKALYPNLSEEWLKKNSSAYMAQEEERKKINDAAKALRADEAKLADVVTKFDYWDDAVSDAHLYIDQEDQKQARLFLDILKGIAEDAGKLGGEEGTDWDASTYAPSRKDAAFWAKIDPAKGIHTSQDAMREADKMLRKKAGEAWNAATDDQKDAIYAYTSSYHNIQEPLRGVTYYGSSSSKSAGLARIPRITEIIESSSYDFDMWVQRFDDSLSLMKFGINPYETITTDMMMALVGKTGTEGAFWSAGCARGGGYSARRNIIYNIYCPKGTKMMYIEPISASGKGSGRSWDGKSSQNSFGSEIEALIQRGTTFRVTKVEKQGSGSFDSVKWFIDVEIIAQKPLPFPYAGGKYPYTKFEP